MGIKNFSAFLRWKAPNVKKTIPATELAGKTLGVDAYWMIYNGVIGIRATGRDFTNEKGEITSHLVVLIQRINIMLRHGITPVFVFDGPENEIKRPEIEKRSAAKEKVRERLKEAEGENNKELSKSLFRRSYTISGFEVRSAQKLLDLLGIPWIQAPGEADVVLAYLCQLKLTSGVISDDSDMLIHGATVLYPQFFQSIKKGKVNEIRLRDLRDALEMSQRQLVELAILMGTAYYNPPKGMGFKTAFNKLQSTNFSELTKDSEDAKIAKKYYLKASYKIRKKYHIFELGELDIPHLRKFLQRNSFQKKTINTMIAGCQKARIEWKKLN